MPFYVRTGKRLGRNLTEIAVHFKPTPQALFARTPDEEIDPNIVAMRIQPNEGITVTFGAKRPGFEMRTSTVHMDFCYQREFGVESPAAYEMLLLDVMRGDATLFIRADEVGSAVAFDHADRRSMGRTATARVSELRRRQRWPSRPPTSCWRATAIAGVD